MTWFTLAIILGILSAALGWFLHAATEYFTIRFQAKKFQRKPQTPKENP
jgi:hypothetical protein